MLADSTRHRVALFFESNPDAIGTTGELFEEMEKQGFDVPKGNVSQALLFLTERGFLMKAGTRHKQKHIVYKRGKIPLALISDRKSPTAMTDFSEYPDFELRCKMIREAWV